MTDFAVLDRRALEVAQTVVDRITPGHLDLPTPCAAWDLRQLLAHIIGQNHGFAASALGETSDLGIWADRPVGAELSKEFADSAAAVVTAFTGDGVADRTFWLPEIRADGGFPARLGMSFHFVDSVVHAWDVAATIGVPVRFEEDLLQVALRVAEMVPNAENRRVPGASFRPGLMPPNGASTLDRVLALLGRSPSWPD